MNELAVFLLRDINNAHRLHEDYEEETEHTLEVYFEELENYLNGSDSGPTFSDHCGIESQYFPPADFFSVNELELICEAFDKMMLTYNLTIDYPENVPVSFLYGVMVKTLDAQTSLTGQGMVHFDYCSGFAPDCVWKEFCPCLEVWNREDDTSDVDLWDQDELPF
ncbi:hypothetical protein [Kaistella palustris]|uniref:hypothetical protein n=1 Tax=Kaistella palustris TaxID=493376 RepID=UPI00042319ED|nr:hypothetical protein [Kaistella palustris]